MDKQKLKEQLVDHEGIRLTPYLCSAGRRTIGIGRNLDQKGISAPEAFYLLENDIRECLIDVKSVFPDFDNFPENIQLVLVDMRFNLGSSGFRGFRKMIDAARRRDWSGMKTEMVNSNWYNQVGRRSRNLARMVDFCIQKKGGDNYE
ncbi:MAG: glycoside hydrolase family protein [Thermodesulfobacteriota bacterium]